MPASSRRARILIVDDIPEFLTETAALLSSEFKASTCPSPLQAIEWAIRGTCDLVLTTLVMKELDGFDVIRRLRGAGLTLPIIMVTGYGSSNTAVEALRLGANDYLAKPVEPEELRIRVRRALALAESPGDSPVFLTRHPATQELLRLVKRVAASDARVLITGETGTGKELVAHLLHQQSPRRAEPFVAVNCAALPGELIESELFGHERGAFTGAVKRRAGKFELAGRGTVFLDEVGELNIAMQSKLLRVLQGGDFQRVGGSAALQLGARVVAATNRDLRQEVQAGRFREDLYFRLNVVPLRLPSLRERRVDIRLLASHFARRFAASPKQAIRLSAAAWAALERYDWPGNVRELEHVVERLSILHAGRDIDVAQVAALADSPRRTSAPPSLAPYAEALAAFRQAYFQQALDLARGQISAAARIAGMDKAQFHRTAIRLGLWQSRPAPRTSRPPAADNASAGPRSPR